VISLFRDLDWSFDFEARSAGLSTLSAAVYCL